jgi:large subunit ribosomal protein L46
VEVPRKRGHYKRRAFARGEHCALQLTQIISSLLQSAARDLKGLCGEGMDTWIVSRKPIGLYEIQPPAPDTSASPKVRLPLLSECKEIIPSSEKTSIFFFKAHIMAGQVKPSTSVADFAWLTKKEIEKRVDERYWEGVKDMLSDF